MDKETKELIEENNHILRKMQSHQRWGSIFSLIYWLFVIGSIIGTYYYFRPVLDALGTSYEEVQNSLQGLKKAGSKIKIPVELQKAVEKLRSN